jgi:hypothetical protein
MLPRTGACLERSRRLLGFPTPYLTALTVDEIKRVRTQASLQAGCHLGETAIRFVHRFGSWHDGQVQISHAGIVELVAAAAFVVLLFIVIALVPDSRTAHEKRRDEQKTTERQDEALTPKVDPNEPARWVP